MEREKKDKDFIHQPEYPGGVKAMNAFIYGQLRYPADALAAGIEGRVIVECDINDEGVVVNTRIIKGLGYGCDEEAVRVVRLLRFRVRRSRGLRVLYHKKIHISFKRPPLQMPVPVPQQMTVQYHYTPRYTSSEEAPESSTGYQYTITWTPA
jgi:protein TonB